MARRRVGRNWAGKIRKTNNVADKKLNILTWGRPGSGKTWFMGTAPKPFIIAAEDGVLTLHEKEIDYVLLDPEEKVYDTVMIYIDDARKKLGVFEDIETICVDSLWKLNQMLLDEIIEEAGREKAERDDWGMLLTRISKIMSNLLAMDYHCITSVGEQIKEDAMNTDKKNPLMLPEFNMSGSYKSQVAYEFDFNLYFEQKPRGARVDYMAYPLPHDKRNAKSRVKLPNEMKDITFDFILNKVNEELGA